MGTKLLPDMSNLDNLADAKPHYYGDDFPNGEVSNFDYNAQSLKLGGKVIYEWWALPAWAAKDYTDPEGKVHKGAANVPCGRTPWSPMRAWRKRRPAARPT